MPPSGLVCLQHESPLRGSTAAASTTTGPCPPPRRTYADPGDTPWRTCSSWCSWPPSSRLWTSTPDLLRTSVATPGNDHRLGANEAPPAIISIFVGEELEAVIDAIASDSPYAGPVKMKMDLAVDVLPKFSKDTTDRNRTSLSPLPATSWSSDARFCSEPQRLRYHPEQCQAKELKGSDELKVLGGFYQCRHRPGQARTIRDHRRVIFNGQRLHLAGVGGRGCRCGLAQQEEHPSALLLLIDPARTSPDEESGVLTKVGDGEPPMKSRWSTTCHQHRGPGPCWRWPASSCCPPSTPHMSEAATPLPLQAGRQRASACAVRLKTLGLPVRRRRRHERRHRHPW